MKTSARLTVACALSLALAACSGSKSSSNSPPAQPPEAPTSVGASAGDGQVTVSWATVSGASSYNVYRSTASGVTKANGTRIAGVSSPYTDTGRTDGTTYYYVITSVNGNGESAESAQVSATPVLAAPAAPTGVSATPGDGTVSVAWTNVAGASSYDVYWSTTPGVTKANGTKITGATSPYAYAGTNGVTYYFVVTAVNAGGESAGSAQVSAVPSANPAPAAPTGMTATAGDGTVSVAWTNVAGATSYDVYWSTTAGVTKANGTRITGATNPYGFSGSNGTTYYFVVTALNANGESTDSAQVSATPRPPPPAAPTGVSAVAGNGQNTVSWTTVGGLTYNIYWSTTSGVTKANGTKIAGVTSPYVHTGRTNATTYYYVVTAQNAGGESADSAQVSATPVAPAGAPTGVTATPGGGQITVAWSAMPGATSYDVYWSGMSGVTPSNGTRVSVSSGTQYVHSGLTPGMTYYYVVTSVNGGGESAASAQVSASPTPIVYSVSGTVSAGASTGSGRVYVELVPAGCVSSCSGQYGTSLAGPGAYTIRGVTSGSYFVRAYRDTIGQGAENATFPSGTTASFTVSGTLTGRDVTLANAAPPAPVAPANVGALPGDGGAFVGFDPVIDASGVETVDHYDLAWGTDATASTGGGTLTIPANGNGYALVGLTNGTPYYVKVRSKVGANASAWSAVFGPFTPAASASGGAGTYTLSGTISLPVTPAGPLYVALGQPQGPPSYVARIQSPSASQAYAFLGIPAGTWQVYVILDQNGNGIADAGDVFNINGSSQAPLVTLTGNTVQNVSLSGADGFAMASTNHWKSGTYESYGAGARVFDGKKLIVAATLTSGGGVTAPVDLARSPWGDFSVWGDLGATRPILGSGYGFDVTYGDGTTAHLTATVTTVLDAFAQGLTVTPTPSANVPTFSWSAPSSPPASYGYDVQVYGGAGAGWWYPSSDPMPSTQTSVQYNVDGTASPTSLVTGTTYTWSVQVQDALGNSCSVAQNYTP